MKSVTHKYINPEREIKEVPFDWKTLEKTLGDDDYIDFEDSEQWEAFIGCYTDEDDVYNTYIFTREELESVKDKLIEYSKSRRICEIDNELDYQLSNILYDLSQSDLNITIDHIIKYIRDNY